MSKIKYTPGPWFVTASGDIACKREDALAMYEVAKPWANIQLKPREYYAEREANARLIAAAPEMLEALKQVLTTQLFISESPWFEIKQLINKIEGNKND